MARVKISFPDTKEIFHCAIPVRVTDLNYGNHVGNDAVLAILHEARMQWLAAHHYTELHAGGTSLIMGDVAISYKNESFYGDVLHIQIFANDISAVSFDLLYKIMAMREGKTITIAEAKTGMVCFDYEKRKVAVLTADLKRLLEGVAK